MNASPVARLVVWFLGIAALAPIVLSCVGSLLRGQPISADVLDLAGMAMGGIVGLLAKTYLDRLDPGAPPTEVVGAGGGPVEVTDADPPPVEPA